jgi:hypothetical protein
MLRTAFWHRATASCVSTEEHLISSSQRKRGARETRRHVDKVPFHRLQLVKSLDFFSFKTYDYGDGTFTWSRVPTRVVPSTISRATAVRP